MSWDVPKIWKNETCWIVGGGASITTQFNIPKRVVSNVREHKADISVYSKYMSLLHDKHVIGVNGAFKLGDWVDICFFGDKEWYFDNKLELDVFNGIIVGCPNFLASNAWDFLGVKHVQKAELAWGITETAGEVRWNYNSGSAAINLAYHLGCTRIILLGFDMCLDATGKGHWHDLYNGKQDMPFERHLKGFDSIAHDAKRLGIEIINASPISKITQFPKASIRELKNI